MKSIYDAAYQRFLAELRDAREHAKLSQADLAVRLQKHQTYVSKVEQGQRALELVEYLKWARELGCDPHGLIAGLTQEILTRRPRRRNADNS